MTDLVFVTHTDVVIDPAVPVPDWRLSARGRERMEAFASTPVLRKVRALFASGERKAHEAAEILAQGLALPPPRIVPGLHENDRSSTGYLEPAAFEAMADAFFARPEESVRGWERAVDAQRRIVAAIAEVLRLAPSEGDIAVVGHGATGTLLRCHVEGLAIARAHDQPPTGGGNWFAFDRATTQPRFTGWRTI